MEYLIQAALPSLARDLEFQVEKISGTDLYYTDGAATGSFLKLLLHKKEAIISVYFFQNGTYWSTSTIPQEDKSILDGWLETVRSQHVVRKN